MNIYDYFMKLKGLAYSFRSIEALVNDEYLVFMNFNDIGKGCT